MGHTHDELCPTVNAYIVYENKVLLVHHKRFDRWLPPGGHIEPGEDPESALIRELEEETGLNRDNLEIWGKKPDLPEDESDERVYLFPPVFMDVHKVSETHRHIGMVYFIRTNSEYVELDKKEHNDIRWFTLREMKDPKYDIPEDLRFYAWEALKRFYWE